MANHAKSADIRSKVKHPVIDSDGHLREFQPVYREYVNKVGGSKMYDRVIAALDRTFVSTEWYRLTPEQRRDLRSKRSIYWGSPTENTVDFATSMFPDLMYQRLDEIGMDFAVLYPSLSIVIQTIDDDEARQAGCRAANLFYAEVWCDHQDRMTPVAAIPMHTPQEAIAELEYAVGKLGIKAVMLASHVKRPVPAVARKYPEATRWAFWLDTFGIDSDYDYDPVWAKCQELKVVPTFHGPGEAWGSRTSISNTVYNHVGHFAASQDAVCKSLFLGGVTKRFPGLKFAFLEGGVGWARSLLADLTSHWEKRSLEGLYKYTDPRNINLERLADLYRTHGGKLKREISIDDAFTRGMKVWPADPGDEFPGLGIKTKQDLRDLFVPFFFFGCESDDPVTASAFDAKRNPFQVRLNAFWGSDISHWDVPDMSEVMEEAWEMVEKEMITENDFRDFVFTNPIRLWCDVNPDFFKGTVVEHQVAKVLNAR